MDTKIIMPPDNQGGVLLTLPVKKQPTEKKVPDEHTVRQVMAGWLRTYLIQKNRSRSLVLIFEEKLEYALLQAVLDLPGQTLTANGILVMPTKVVIKSHPDLGKRFVHFKNPNDLAYRKIRASFPDCQITWRIGDIEMSRQIDQLGVGVAHNLRTI